MKKFFFQKKKRKTFRVSSNFSNELKIRKKREKEKNTNNNYN